MKRIGVFRKKILAAVGVIALVVVALLVGRGLGDESTAT